MLGMVLAARKAEPREVPPKPKPTPMYFAALRKLTQEGAKTIRVSPAFADALDREAEMMDRIVLPPPRNLKKLAEGVKFIFDGCDIIVDGSLEGCSCTKEKS